MRKITWRMTEMLLPILKAFAVSTHYILCVAAEQSVAPSFSPPLVSTSHIHPLRQTRPSDAGSSVLASIFSHYFQQFSDVSFYHGFFLMISNPLWGL
jgi:hypothetical protein